MNGNPSVPDFPLISTESAEESIFRACGLFMGRGRKFSVEDVAIGTGIKAGTLHSYIAAEPTDRRTPPSGQLLRLCQFFGVQFTSKLLGRIGQGARNLEPVAADPSVIVAKLSIGLSEFATRAVDHIYCNADHGALEPVADEMIQILEPFSAGGGHR